MSVKIKYNGVEPFDGLPLPFVERGVEYIEDNSNVEAVESIVLTGQIPPSGAPDCDRFTYFIDEQASILNYFSEAYKKFEIIEDGVVIVSRENVRIDSIDFSDSNYSSILEYSINLSVYRGDFMVHSGVVDVSNSISYKENENKTLNITHSVSATGARDSVSSSSTSALQKAKAFVEGEISRQKIDVPPVFVSHAKASDSEAPMTPTATQTAFLETVNPVLVSFSENINRLAGIYSITKEYISDLYFYEGGVLRYSAEVDLSPSGYSIVSLRGEVTYEEDLSGAVEFDALVERYKSFDFFGAAKRLSGLSGLNKVPISRSISKDEGKNIISFDFSFDDNPQFFDENGAETVLDFNFTNDSNFISVSIRGSIIARLGIKNKWEVAKREFDNLDIPAKAKVAYESYLKNVLGYGDSLVEKMPFNTNILGESVTFRKSEGAVEFSYNFDNFSQTPNNDIFKSFDYSVNVVHPTSSYMSTKEYVGGWVVQDMDAADRGSKSISGSAIKKAGVTCAQATEAIVAFMEPKALLTETQRQISFDGVSAFTFSFSWSTGDSVAMIGGSTDGVAEIELNAGELISMS